MNNNSPQLLLLAGQVTAPGNLCVLMIECSRRGGHDIPLAVQ